MAFLDASTLKRGYRTCLNHVLSWTLSHDRRQIIAAGSRKVVLRSCSGFVGYVDQALTGFDQEKHPKQLLKSAIGSLRFSLLELGSQFPLREYNIPPTPKILEITKKLQFGPPRDSSENYRKIWPTPGLS